MSHVAAIDLHVRDLDALEKACEELGLELRRGQKTFHWYGRWVNDYDAEQAAYRFGIDPKDYGKCEHAIAVKGKPGAYEIGLVARPDGKPGWLLAFDFWGSQGATLSNKIGGETAGKLKQAYGVNVAIRTAIKQGFTYQRVVKQDGTVQVIASKP